jgi:SAM-dependent methyltransferase/uncharacterized protein YbaR (Trm112 family)
MVAAVKSLAKSKESIGMEFEPRQTFTTAAAVAPVRQHHGTPQIPANLPADLVEHLRCPLTHSPLRWTRAEELENLNAASARGDAAHLDGSKVDGQIPFALINEEGSLAYRVDDGILMMLPISAIATDRQVIAKYGNAHRPEKIAIQSFYDQIGWKADEKGDFEDAVLWEDLRPVSADYIHKCHLRVKRYLRPAGNYFLDVASGPVQYPEYLTYSKDYQHRICMDISIRALREARKRVGAQGIYILGDITNLPLRDNALDAVVSLHTIYHVPQDEQAKAFEELYRVLKPGRSGAIVYTFSTAPLITAGAAPARWWKKARTSAPIRFIKNLLGRKEVPASAKAARPRDDLGGAPFYFKAHPLKFFTSRKWSFPVDIVVWRSMNIWFMRTYIHPRRFGKLLLAIIYRLEEFFPRFMGRQGPYPMFVLRKHL